MVRPPQQLFNRLCAHLSTHVVGAKYKAMGRQALSLASLCLTILLSAQATHAAKHATALPIDTIEVILDKCIAGTPASEVNHALRESSGGDDFTFEPVVAQWIKDQHWNAGYQLWQASRNTVCQNPQDGLSSLLMHHYLAEALKSRWPNLDHHFNGWSTFPKNQDHYPSTLNTQFHAWSDNTLQAASIVDRIRKMSKDELLSRWPSEGELGHWLECGSSDTQATSFGLKPDNPYQALLFNGLSTSTKLQSLDSRQRLGTYLFWKNHGWVNQAWMHYRKKVGHSISAPQIQADLLDQCQTHNAWIEYSKTVHKKKITKNNAPLYLGGGLNPAHKNTVVRVLGEVIDISENSSGKLFYRVDLKLKGVNHVWITGAGSMSKQAIVLGQRYIFIGDIMDRRTLSLAVTPPHEVKTSSLLIARSIQSPK